MHTHILIICCDAATIDGVDMMFIMILSVYYFVEMILNVL